MSNKPLKKSTLNWRRQVHEIIFEADTFSGKLFDVALLIAILGSILAVMLESVESIYDKYGPLLRGIEWGFTILFTIEYIARIISVKKPQKYIYSFYGLIDLLSVIPTYLSLVIVGPQYFAVIRTVRLLRVFRILKLTRYLGEASLLISALRASRAKIIVFIGAVLTVVVIMGTLMFLIEGKESGFTSIPTSIYWAIVTLTTVGYGDIAPDTVVGQVLASIIMILGYGVIAVPTGIVSAEMVKPTKKTNTQSCPSCSREGHEDNAVHCKFCGQKL